MSPEEATRADTENRNEIVSEKSDDDIENGELGDLVNRDTNWWKSRKCVFAIAGYANCAFIYSLFDEMTAVFSSAPKDKGGLALTPQNLSIPLMVAGISLASYTFGAWGTVLKRVGTIRAINIGCYVTGLAALLSPVSSILPISLEGIIALTCFIFALKAIGSVHHFTTSMVLVNETSPPSQLGRANGAAQAAASALRALGPTMGGASWSISLLIMGSRVHQFAAFAVIQIFIFLQVWIYRHF